LVGKVEQAFALPPHSGQGIGFCLSLSGFHIP
jgi:hypothetical protein